jgi:hypothetical protein
MENPFSIKLNTIVIIYRLCERTPQELAALEHAVKNRKPIDGRMFRLSSSSTSTANEHRSDSFWNDHQTSAGSVKIPSDLHLRILDRNT